MSKCYGMSNKTIKAMIVGVRDDLRKIAKPNAVSIRRKYRTDETEMWTDVQQTDRNRFVIRHVSKKYSGVVWLVDNQIEHICIGMDGQRYFGNDCAGRVTPFIDEVKAHMFANTPRGKLQAAMETVRDYLQLCSKGSSGRVSRKLEWNGSTYRAWCTPGGGFMLISVSMGARKDVILKLEKGETAVSYEEYSKKYNCYIDFHDDQACNRSVKLLKAMFRSAFLDGKGLRVS